MKLYRWVSQRGNQSQTADRPTAQVQESLNPVVGGLFDSDWYLSQYPDVAEAGVDPFAHYLQSGATEGREPNPLFDSDWYLSQYPDVAEAGVNPLVHYLQFGATE